VQLVPASDDELARVGSVIEDWAAGQRETASFVLAVDHDPELRRWYVRLRGDDKQHITVWLTVRQRTLHYETYFMPAPEEQIEACFEYLLRVNARLGGMRFAIGAEDAVYLVGEQAVSAIDTAELDRIIGSSYAWSEECFRQAMAIGFASRFSASRDPSPVPGFKHESS